MIVGEGYSSKTATRTHCGFLFAGVFIFALGILGGLFIGIYAYHGASSDDQSIEVQCVFPNGQSGQTDGDKTTPVQGNTTTAPDTCQRCSKRNPVQPADGDEIFSPLTKEEMELVRTHLINEGLATSAIGLDISLTSNYIVTMDIYIPNKQNVLNYLDNNGAFPGRFAEVTVVRGEATYPDVMQYLVGPLENQTSMQVKKLLSDGDVNYNTRAIDFIELNELQKLLLPSQQILQPLVNESFDGAAFDDGLLYWWAYNGVIDLAENKREVRINLFLNPVMVSYDYSALDMLPLGCVVDTAGSDPQQWTVHSFHYLNQGPFDTASELVDAYNAGSINKVALPKGYRETVKARAYTGRDNSKPSRVNAHMSPPRTYEPDGPRYTIKGHHVSWMGWSFDVTSRMMRGAAIFNVEFKGERIAYEVALNDITLIYGSDTYERSNVFYTDSTYGIGLYNGVIRGIDCPEHANILDTSFFDSYSSEAQVTKSICIFEADGEGPLWRHKVNGHQAGLRDTYLVARMGGAIANYDYIVEFKFKLDGKLFTNAFATGAPQAAFWYADNPNHDPNDDSPGSRDAFGFKVSDYAHGMIHDHMFGFKVDLDVITTNNSFEVIHFKTGDVVDAFKSMKPATSSKPSYYLYNTTRYLTYETVQTEAGYKVQPMHPQYWTIVNENYRNKWGVKRGYQIMPLSTSTQILTSPHPAMNAISWTKYNCAVTKHRDTEQFMDSIFDGFRLNNAKSNFDNYLNNESIVNEDLVAWVGLGVVHIPSSEDVPMTVALDTGFVIKPYNFFDRTDVYDMPQYYEADQDRQRPPEFDPCLEDN